MKLITLNALAGLLLTGAAHAAGIGCEAFAWKLDAERALLAAPEAGEKAAPPTFRALAMKPLPRANLPMPPERAPREPGTALAGATRVSVPEAGLYRVTLPEEGWLDVIQNGAYRRPEAFTGAKECPGLRKSVRFRLDAGEAIIQVTGQATMAGLAFTREP